MSMYKFLLHKQNKRKFKSKCIFSEEGKLYNHSLMCDKKVWKLFGTQVPDALNIFLQ